MPDQTYDNRLSQDTDSSNLFQYQQDTINQYQQQQQQQQQQKQQVLPKVRNGNPGTPTYRLPPLNAAPATPRMLRNASNSVLNPSNNNLNDYHINTNFQLQNSQRPTVTPSLTPQRAVSSPNPRGKDSLQFVSQQSPARQPPSRLGPLGLLQSPVERQLSTFNTPPRSSLLPAASVDASSGSLNTEEGHRRAPSQSTRHSRTASHKQPHPQVNADGQFHRKSIGEWDFYKTIGAGSMGKVKLAKHRRTNEVCAIKVVPRAEKIWLRQHSNDPPTSDSNETAKRLKEYEKEVARDKRTIREAALDKIMYHPYICRLYELIPMTNHYYMLFEYVSGGQMLDYIVSHGSLKERHARKFARGIASALDYCHSNNIVHRDLKIENIMISKTGEVKIIDFGLSNLYDRNSQLKTFCGSLYFAAPELLSAQPYLGPEVDIWSFGVVLYVLVCGKVPFDDPSVSALHGKIKQGNVTYPDHLSWSCVSLLQKMLVVDPHKRASLKEIINHTWMIDESEKPAYNYLPHRVPLSLPLDLEVIHEILNLQLASEEQAIHDLTEILTSPEYSKAVANWYARTSGNYLPDGDSDALDPTRAYHPMISIYYLVDEMQKRKKLKEMNSKSQLQQTQELRQKQLLEEQQQKSAALTTPIMTQAPFASARTPRTPQPSEEIQQPGAPVISFPEAAYTAPHGQSNYGERTSTSEERTPMVTQQDNRSQSPKSRKTSNIDHTLGSGNSADDEFARSGFNSLLRKLSGKRSKQQYQQQPFSNSDFERRVPMTKSPSPIDVDGPSDAYQPQPFQPLLDTMVRRVGSMKITSKEKEQASGLMQDFPPLPTKYEQQLQMHQRALSTSASAKKASNNGPEQLSPAKVQTISNHNRKMHPSARAKSVGHARIRNGNAPPVPPVPQVFQDDGFFDDVNLNDDEYSRKQDNAANLKNSELTEQQLITNFENAPSGTMPSIEYPRTLFLKGFFSVQTTSTKPLPVIRNNIIIVLSKLGVQFTEVKGGFICVHSPSITTSAAAIEANTPQDDDLEIQNEQQSESTLPTTLLPPPTQEVEMRRSSSSASSSGPKPLTSEAITNDNDELSLTSSLVSSPSSTSKGHRRKFSLGNGLLRKKPEQPGRLNTNLSANVFDTSNMPVTPAPANVHGHRHSHSINSTESQDSVDSLHEIKGESDMILSSRVDQMKSPAIGQNRSSFGGERAVKVKSTVKFEIHIVKVPLVGLFGVQFKKLSGNTWMYKTLAGEILRELNL